MNRGRSHFSSSAKYPSRTPPGGENSCRRSLTCASAPWYTFSEDKHTGHEGNTHSRAIIKQQGGNCAFPPSHRQSTSVITLFSCIFMFCAPLVDTMLFKDLFLITCMHVYLYVSVHMRTGSRGELMWVTRAELGASARIVHALNSLGHLSSPIWCYLKWFDVHWVTKMGWCLFQLVATAFVWRKWWS